MKSWDELLAGRDVWEVIVHIDRGVVELRGRKVVRRRVKRGELEYVRMKLLEYGYMPVELEEDEEAWISPAYLDPLI